MTLKCQNLKKNGIENETFECPLMPKDYNAFKSFFLDSISFQILKFQCHLMPTLLLGIPGGAAGQTTYALVYYPWGENIVLFSYYSQNHYKISPK